MISGILLAAGESRRMGSPKALLRYRGQTFIERGCLAFLDAGVEELIVVLGARAAELRQALPPHPGLRTVENPRYFQGQLSSLMAGIGALSPESEAAVVNLVDHPLVTAETVGALIASFRAAPVPILIAAHQGRRGHPVLFSSQVYGEILAAPLDRGAKVVVRKDPSRVREIQLDDPGILADIDTPEDYARYIDHT
ncbi:MAG TPA: nucleotidyltransferase family protein [Candidatus Binatia bacterium]|nr:nucleotidyltransferase family protein [Candidatus Binatia bacterium]